MYSVHSGKDLLHEILQDIDLVFRLQMTASQRAFFEH